VDGLRRREFVTAGAAAAGALAFGPSFWRRAFEAHGATPGVGPYGPLQPPDANGIMLPRGFTSREIARGEVPVAGTGYVWHIFSDGQATYDTGDGGWILVSNSEAPPDVDAPPSPLKGGGSSAIRFRADGTIADAYRILGGTETNCAGGRTPWGTWLSCEEYEGGRVWEADPMGRSAAIVRPAMGAFTHEAAAVDPVGKQVYLTEDKPDGGFYRFTPARYPDLSSGLLEVAVVTGASVSWAVVPDPSAISVPTRSQVPGMTRFASGEGIWFDSGTIYFTTKGDNRVWAYDTERSMIETIYDLAVTPDGPLSGVDNVTVSSFGDVYVCEDGGNLEICVITPEREVAPVMRVTGPAHEGVPGTPVSSEIAGVIFDPSGRRMYFSSQRGFVTGVVYEVSGPFRTDAGRTGAPLAAGTVGAGEPPAIRVTTRRRVSYRRLLRRLELAVRVSVSEPGDVAVSLTTPDVNRVRGERGSTDRPKLLTLGRRRRRFRRRGAENLIVKLDRSAVRQLRRGRSVSLRVTAQLRDGDGNVDVATREIRVEFAGTRRPAAFTG